MKKRFLTVLLVVVLALVFFVACKDTGKTTDPTEAPKGTDGPTAEPTAEPTPTPVPGPKTYYDYDFSDEEVDEAPYLDGWTFVDVAAGGNSKVRKDGDNLYFFITGFITMTYDEYMEKAYEWSFDAKGVSAVEVAATFVRGSSMLTLPVSTNPNGCGYYEADDSGSKYTSTTGIGLWFKGNGALALFVKTNDTSKPAGIGNIEATISCTYDASKWNKIKIVDDFQGKIDYYVNDEKVATVEYSNLGEYEVFPGEKFYKTATIKDKDGNVITSTENAFIYEISEIAFGFRTGSLSIDNLLLKDKE